MTISACRKYIEEQILSIADDCASVEAEQILIEVLQVSRTYLYAYPEREIQQESRCRIEELTKRRAAGEPLQYILGEAPFMGFEFIVRTGVLIPRRDTEVLVENALPYCQGKRVLDLCTGSGCIGISVALLGNPAVVALSDISPIALNVAGENAERHGISPVFYEGNFLKAIPANITFDVILSNPPYITSTEMETLPLDVRKYEPALALQAGSDGLEAYREILQDVDRVLVPGGYVFFEIGCAQGMAVSGLLQERGFSAIQVLQDYGGRDRVVFGRR